MYFGVKMVVNKTMCKINFFKINKLKGYPESGLRTKIQKSSHLWVAFFVRHRLLNSIYHC